MKRCGRCGEAKPLTEFHAKTAAKDGLQAHCKGCGRVSSNASSKKRYEANPSAHAARMAEWYGANRDAIREHHAAYRLQNAERIKAYRDAYNERNRDIVRARVRASYHKNPEAKKRQRQRVRARLAEVRVEDVNRFVVFDRDGGVCGICGQRVAREAFEIDHIVPIARGGEHSYANTQIAHRGCNRRKGSKMPEEMAA